jgi:hypothetical protein
MKRTLKNDKGNSIITTPIIIAIGMMLVATLIVVAVKIITPYIWYEKLSSTCIKYVFVMEEYGYLTNTEKNNLIAELEEQGFEKANLKVTCTNKRQNYGSPIYLHVDYTYKTELPVVGEKIIPMSIKRESVSKR